MRSLAPGSWIVAGPAGMIGDPDNEQAGIALPATLGASSIIAPNTAQ